MSIWLSSVHCITPSSIVRTCLSGGRALYTEVRSEGADVYMSVKCVFTEVNLCARINVHVEGVNPQPVPLILGLTRSGSPPGGPISPKQVT